MISNITSPQPKTYTKNSQDNDNKHINMKRRNKKTIFGIDQRSLLAAIGLTSFLLLTMAGVYIALKQRATNYSTTPEESQAAKADKSNCTLSFNVPRVEPFPAFSCNKYAYQDELSNSAGNYQLLTQKTTFKPGETIVFAVNLDNIGNTPVTVNVTDILSANGLQHTTFLDSNCGENAYDSTSQTLTCGPISLPFFIDSNSTADEDNMVIFRVKINDDIPVSSITNTAIAKSDDISKNCPVSITVETESTPTPTPTPIVTPTPTPTTEIDCGDTCSNSDQCPNDHTCSNNKCVYNPCLVTGVTCDSTQCVIINPQPTPTPAAPVGCNDACVNNADCDDPGHICWTGVCRLSTNPNSTTCTNPPGEVITIIQQQETQTQTQVVEQPEQLNQPVLPEQLPETGIVSNTLRIVGGASALVILAGALMILL